MLVKSVFLKIWWLLFYSSLASTKVQKFKDSQNVNCNTCDKFTVDIGPSPIIACYNSTRHEYVGVYLANDTCTNLLIPNPNFSNVGYFCGTYYDDIYPLNGFGIFYRYGVNQFNLYNGGNSFLILWCQNVLVSYGVPSVEPLSCPAAVTPCDAKTSITPSLIPTNIPTIKPMQYDPSVKPTLRPSFTPSNIPSIKPVLTFDSSVKPTLNPIFNPTNNPIVEPTFLPSVKPTLRPSITPTYILTEQPINNPIVKPSIRPTSIPSNVARNYQSSISQATSKTGLTTDQEIIVGIFVTLFLVIFCLCACCMIVFVKNGPSSRVQTF